MKLDTGYKLWSANCFFHFFFLQWKTLRNKVAADWLIFFNFPVILSLGIIRLYPSWQLQLFLRVLLRTFYISMCTTQCFRCSYQFWHRRLFMECHGRVVQVHQSQTPVLTEFGFSSQSWHSLETFPYFTKWALLTLQLCCFKIIRPTATFSSTYLFSCPTMETLADSMFLICPLFTLK